MKQTVYLSKEELHDAVQLYLATKGLSADFISLQTRDNVVTGRTHTMICRGVSSIEPYVLVKKSTINRVKQKISESNDLKKQVNVRRAVDKFKKETDM